MFKAVVIDDNIMFLKSLTVAMPWEELGCVMAGTAENGMDGKALIERVRPELVITDIQMPGLDGLEMIGRIREQLAGSKIIVATGFEKFDYAKRALELHVDAFLMKPVDLPEFRSCIREQVAKLAEEDRRQTALRRAEEERGELLRQKRQSERIHKSNLLHRLLHQPGAEDGELIAQLRQAGLPDNGYVAVGLDWKDTALYNTAAAQKIAGHVRGCLDARVLAEVLDVVYGHIPLLVLFYSPEAGASGFPAFVRSVRIAFGELVATGAIGGVLFEEEGPGRLSSLRAACESVAAELEWRRYRKPREMPDSAEPPSDSTGHDLVAYFNHFLDDIEKEDDPDKARAALKKLTRGLFHRQARSLRQVKTAEVLFCYLFASRFQAQLGELGDMDDVAETVQALPNIGGVEDYLYSLYEKATESKRRRAVAYSPLIQALLRYIQNNLCEDISLQKAAETLAISPNYLSARIKKETGDNFINIVVAAKMAFAKKQLADTKRRVEEIGAMVGYQNYISFYKVFRKYENMSPQEYRKRLLP